MNSISNIVLGGGGHTIDPNLLIPMGKMGIIFIIFRSKSNNIIGKNQEIEKNIPDGLHPTLLYGAEIQILIRGQRTRW